MKPTPRDGQMHFYKTGDKSKITSDSENDNDFNNNMKVMMMIIQWKVMLNDENLMNDGWT